MTDGDDPFRAYHRARWRMSLGRVTAIVGVSGALVTGLTLLVAAAPPPSAPLQAVVTESVAAEAQNPSIPTSAPPSPGTEQTVALPTPVAAPADAPAPTQPALPSTGPASWTIDIDTRGYQAEIDRCLWVRMDLGTTAPIVGAHNYCGGGDVLEMRLGDIVTLSGVDLEGTYIVSDARDARAGDIAATAVAGMVGSVILQTCYWQDDGTVRLVGITPVG